MSVKILVDCRNPNKLPTVFANMETGFECISTSDFTEDIIRHAECYKPDMFLTFFETFDYNTMQQYYHLKTKKELENIPFAMIASSEVCKQAQVKTPDLFEWVYAEPDDPQKSRILLSEVAKRAAEFKHEPLVLIGDENMDSSTRKHIMVVDDDKVTLRMLKTALEEKLYEVTAMASGKIAEKYLQLKTVDLILLDYQMPQESGAEVLKNIREDSRLKDIPVIFLTGVSDSDRVQEVISMSPQGYLLKPVNMERLFIMIHNLI